MLERRLHMETVAEVTSELIPSVISDVSFSPLCLKMGKVGRAYIEFFKILRIFVQFQRCRYGKQRTTH